MDNENIQLPAVSIQKITDVLEKPHNDVHVEIGANAFYISCKRVAKFSGIRIERYTKAVTKENYAHALEEMSHISEFRYRKVLLRGNWLNYDNGPLLAFKKGSFEPCALVPHKSGYLLIEADGKETIVTKEVAKLLAKEAYFFYKRFPKHPLSLKDIIKFTWPYIKYDLRRAVLLQLLVSLMGLFVPIATGYLFTQAIPFADINALTQVVLALIVNACVITLFVIGQSVSLIRFKLRADVSLEAGIWDRILSFPTQFFKKYDAGDLATRAGGIDYIQHQVTLTLVLAVISGVLSLLTLALMFYISVIVTVMIVILIAVMTAVSFIFTLREIQYWRRHFYLLGKMFSLLLQFFTSISKIRVANAEKRIFQLWLDRFAAKTTMYLKAGNLGVWASLFGLVFSLISTMIFFLFVVSGDKPISLGNFIIYNVAFSQLFASLTAILSAFNQMISLIPIYERIRPILKATPESFDHKGLRHDLKGKIELDKVIFRYPMNNTLVADHLSLDISPGEYVGMIGPSGAGKSTIIRLLLGFELPQAGNVRYDNHDLSTLDLNYMRRQLGVVMQNSSLMPGSIKENIIGINTELTEEDAWAAARLVKIAEDIEEMPMGMSTITSEGGHTLSVGQRQRILLARAIVKKSKVLLLDEAMSGLDDTTQSQIQLFIDQLDITRIIITQRPHFLKSAHVIYIVEGGKIVAKGTYPEIIKTEPFERLKLSEE